MPCRRLLLSQKHNLYNLSPISPISPSLPQAENTLSVADNALFDLQVTVYNINNPTGKQKWEKCRAMLDYSRFVNLTREEHKVNPNGFMERAIRASKKLGILPGFLDRNTKEIENMFFGEYDYDMDIAVQREEAFEDGVAEGEARGEHNKALETARAMLADNMSVEQIAKWTKLPAEEIAALH